MKCPKCGGEKFSFDYEKLKVTCDYCSSEIKLEDEEYEQMIYERDVRREKLAKEEFEQKTREQARIRKKTAIIKFVSIALLTIFALIAIIFIIRGVVNKNKTKYSLNNIQILATYKQNDGKIMISPQYGYYRVFIGFDIKNIGTEKIKIVKGYFTINKNDRQLCYCSANFSDNQNYFRPNTTNQQKFELCLEIDMNSTAIYESSFDELTISFVVTEIFYANGKWVK